MICDRVARPLIYSEADPIFMLTKLTRTITLTAVFSFSLAALSFGQPAVKQLISERNVRAGMTFLASDAMQGRGSGTPFERVAAEYIGSQFMAFGLEPAGSLGRDGKPTFVQTVEVVGRPRLKALKFGRAEGSIYTLGVEWVAVSIASSEIKGKLSKIKLSDSARPGEIVLVSLNEDDAMRTIQPRIDQLFKDGAVAVLLTETKELRQRWSELAERKPSISRRGNVIALRKDAANFLSALSENPANDPIEIYPEFGAAEKSATWNAIGKLSGTDTTLAKEVILFSSHLDHVGVRANAPGDDKIFNGADDDASGSIAVIELARLLSEGKRPKRTVYFVCFGSEEAGGFGANYFVNNLPFPQEKLVANLEFEMIGRPDAKVKPEELWLTGYERSNLGPELARRGAKLVQDPHPEENFFQRSDNYTLARRGIIAHTVSSFGLHTDYHKASDQIETIDFGHLTRSINSMVEPIRWLINSDFKPAWNEGRRP